MRLIQAREQARKWNPTRFEHITFDMMDSSDMGVKCKWINPAEGTFQVIGENGFQTVDDYYNRDPQILNMKIEKSY